MVLSPLGKINQSAVFLLTRGCDGSLGIGTVYWKGHSTESEMCLFFSPMWKVGPANAFWKGFSYLLISWKNFSLIWDKVLCINIKEKHPPPAFATHTHTFHSTFHARSFNTYLLGANYVPGTYFSVTTDAIYYLNHIPQYLSLVEQRKIFIYNKVEPSGHFGLPGANVHF